MKKTIEYDFEGSGLPDQAVADLIADASAYHGISEKRAAAQDRIDNATDVVNGNASTDEEIAAAQAIIDEEATGILNETALENLARTFLTHLRNAAMQHRIKQGDTSPNQRQVSVDSLVTSGKGIKITVA